MPRRRSGERVLGPYGDGGRWKVVHVAPDGTRVTRRFTREKQAEAYAALARTEVLVGDLTVGQALERYEAHLVAKGNAPKSRERTRWGLGKLLPPDLALSDITPKRAAALYQEMSTRYAVDSHRNALAEAKTFLRWCVAQHWIGSDPFADVQGIGRRSKGKPQLRLDEARKWREWALYRAHQGEAGAVAAMLCLYLSLRSSAVVGLRVRDVDDEGRLLWITRDKTTAGRRQLEVPAELVPLLLLHTRGKAPDELLFGAHWRDWPRKWTQRLCREAGVPEVSAHGLRGTHATLAEAAGVSAQAVADQLGHTDTRMAGVAYTAPGTRESAQANRFQGILVPKPMVSDRQETIHPATPRRN